MTEVARNPKPSLRWAGAKWTLASWIVGNMPPHKVYCEPYFGSGAVFFTKTPSKYETINDLDSRVVNLFRVMRDRTQELLTAVELTPYSREEFYLSMQPEPPDCSEVESARRFLVRTWMGFGAKVACRNGWRCCISPVVNKYCPDVWNDLPERISAIVQRLKHAQIEYGPAVECIRRYNKSTEILIYADPPYPLSTRTDRLYSHEMTDEEHSELLDLLDRHPGPVLLSGYHCQLYNERLSHWKTLEHSAFAERGKSTVEVLWLNPRAAGALHPRLFQEEN